MVTWCARYRNTTGWGRKGSSPSMVSVLPRLDLVWEERRYPPKTILGAAYEFATGQRLGSGDFEGAKTGAVAVLTKLGFTIRNKR
jgi:hypothetical protein